MTWLHPAQARETTPPPAAPAQATSEPAAQPPKVEAGRQAGGDKREIIGGAPIDPRTYVIGAEDMLVVRVWKQPDVSGEAMVRPDGKISLQLVGEIQAAGLTPIKLGAAVSTALEKYINRPEVTVTVVKVNSKKYFIQGEVNKAGAYPLVVPMTILEALVNAGGFRDFANTKKIKILRNGEILKFNYKEVIQGKKMEQNILVEPGDQIIVP